MALVATHCVRSDEAAVLDGEVTVDRQLYWWPWGGSIAPGASAVPIAPGAVDLSQSGEVLRGERLVLSWHDGAREWRLAEHTLLSVDVAHRGVTLRGAGRLRAWDARVLGQQYPQLVDEALREQTQPVLIGIARSIPAIPAIASTQTYWVADAPLGAIVAVRDRGVALTPSGDPPPSGSYARVQSGRAVRVGTPALQPLTLDASGYGAPTASVGDVLADYGRWREPWGGITPPGWVTGAGAEATQQIDGSVRRCLLRIVAPQSTGGITQDTSITTPLAPGSSYRLTLRVASMSAVSIAAKTTGGQTIMTRSTTGTHIEDFTVDAGPSSQALVVEIIGGQAAWALIEEVRCTLTDLTPPTAIDTPTAEEYATAIAQRAGIAVDRIASIDLPRYMWGTYVAREARAVDLLRALLDSAGATIVELRDGGLQMRRVVDPASLPMAAVVTPDSMLSEPLCELDQARGLTIKAGAQRNWRVHSGGDVADSVSAALRAQLTSEWRHVVTSTVPLPQLYSHAQHGEMLETVHDDPASARVELDRVLRLYSKPRWRHRCHVDARILGIVPELGQCLGLWTPSGVVPTIVVACRDVVTDGRLTCEVTLWG